jgi:hypothetical protein
VSRIGFGRTETAASEGEDGGLGAGIDAAEQGAQDRAHAEAGVDGSLRVEERVLRQGVEGPAQIQHRLLHQAGSQSLAARERRCTGDSA